MSVRKKSILASSLTKNDIFYVNEAAYLCIDNDGKLVTGERKDNNTPYNKVAITVDSSILIDEYYAEIVISNERRTNLLCSALEGGSNYWYYIGKKAMAIVDEVFPSDGNTPTVDRIWAAIKAGKEIEIRDAEDPREVLGKISLASIANGEQIMAEKYPHHFADIINENDDAITGDVWFQLATMGEVVYG
jgi:hypothetical protein